MMKTRNCSVALWLSSLATVVALTALSNPVHSFTVHPAVLKNFVGPFRVRQREPILRSSLPFGKEETPMLSLVEEPLIKGGEVPSEEQDFLGPRQAAIRVRNFDRLDTEKAIRSCEGGAPCRPNLDSTLNLLMKMMETGR